MFNWLKRKWSEFVALFVQDAAEPEPVIEAVPEPEVKPVPIVCQTCPSTSDCTIKKYDRIEPPVQVARRRPDTTVTTSRVSPTVTRDSYRSRRDDTMLDITSPVSPFYMLQEDDSERHVQTVHVYSAPVHHTYEEPVHHTYEAPTPTPAYTPSYESTSCDSYTSISCD